MKRVTLIDRRRLNGRVLVGLVAASLLQLGPRASAQPPTSLTPALIGERIAALRDSGTPADNEVLTTYEQARAFSNDAESYAREAATFVEAQTGAPQREAEIQQRLDEFDETYDPAGDVAGFTAEELTARLGLAGAQLRELQTQRDALDRRIANLEAAVSAIPARLTEIGQRLAALPESVLTIDPAAPPSLVEAREWRNAAESGALAAERRAREAELTSAPVRRSALVAERTEITLELQRLTQLSRELELRLSQAVQGATELASFDIAATDPAYPIAAAIAVDDAELLAELTGLQALLASVRAQNEDIQRRSQALDERFGTARRIVDYSSNEALGEVLLRYWSELEEYAVDDPTDRVSRDLGRVIISRANHEETLGQLVSAAGFVNQALRSAGLEPESISADSRAAMLDLARAYRERLRAVMAAEADYVSALGELETGYRALDQRSEAYRDFLEGLILWIPNQSPLWTITPAEVLQGIDRFTANVATIRLAPGFGLVLAMITALALLRSRPRLVALQESSTGALGRPQQDSIGRTLSALGAAALRAAPASILLLGLGASIDVSASVAGERLPFLVFRLALLLFAFNIMRIVSEPGGIGRVHFGWRSTTMERIHAELRFLIRWWVPILLAAALVNRLESFAEGAPLARPLILVALIVIMAHLGWYQLREIRVAGRAWFASTYNRLRLLLQVIFVALIGAVLAGQGFSVMMIMNCLFNTAIAAIFLLLTHAVLLRWISVARAKLRLKERQAQTTAATSGSSTPVAEQVADVADVSAATTQLLNAAMIVAATVAIMYIWEPLVPALGALDRIELWTSTSDIEGETVLTRITLATVVDVLILAGLTLYAARRLPALIEIALRSRTSVSPGSRYAISALLNYVIIGVGVVAALSALGLRWNQLQWLIAALGVGIGFGLQEIVANFISGLIILFERPLRVGDVVTVGDKEGTVTKIRMRATTIRDWDGRELLVPNREFVTGRLLNWTLSDSRTRIVINVGVAYGSDIERALQILRDIVRAHPRVLAEPESLIVFEDFGDNALQLSARCFVDSINQRMAVQTELRTAIHRAFHDAGIEIAFPQRDVHIDVSSPLRIALEPAASTAQSAPQPEKPIVQPVKNV